VLTVLYLLFNEGYAATRGTAILRTELSVEAIRLTRVVRSLFGDDPPRELTALLAPKCDSDHDRLMPLA